MAIGINFGDEYSDREYDMFSDIDRLHRARSEDTRKYNALKLAYDDLEKRYMDLTSRMTDEELDAIRAREKN